MFLKPRKGFQEGQRTVNDAIQIKALVNIDTATWPDEFAKVYLNTYLAGLEKEDCIGKLDSQVVVIKVQDANKDIKTYVPYLYLITLVSLKLPTYLQN